MGSRRWMPLLPTTYFLLPTSYFLLPTSYFLFPTSYFLLPDVHRRPNRIRQQPHQIPPMAVAHVQVDAVVVGAQIEQRAAPLVAHRDYRALRVGLEAEAPLLAP